MGCSFREKFVNVRKRLNDAMFHRHDNIYETKGTFRGRTLLVNGDKTVSQLGDFTTPITLDAIKTLYVDRYRSYCSGITATLTHKKNTPGAEGDSILYTVTSTTIGNMVQENSIDISELLSSGNVLTYTALVRSNRPITYGIVQNGVVYRPLTSRGTGEWELLSFTANIQAGVTILNAKVELSEYVTGLTAGDYFEVGREQVELGGKFTGFEDVLPAINLMQCRYAVVPLTCESNYDVIGTFVASNSTTMYCPVYITPMKGLAGIENRFAPLQAIGLASGTLTPNTLFYGPANTDVTLGKVLLTLTGTGLTPGDISVVRKNNSTDIIALVESF